ncbi:putative porin [Cellvibrio japonicus]|uniref:putative porin n=1 Tax=Cellvibrio japonicus TaxID=155077 RepID=UPI00031B87AA|nr:putative porin [Cellvibrio japonicus]QEI11527.1 putative porin [Cellvibrio japonicus]QEI15101.1 putative porin [Cellvibrio japonicus]QEI18681.1 putative porin [Cellvibrio japonicus]
MKLKLLSAVIGLASFSVLANAQSSTYQGEVFAGYGETDDALDSSAYAVGGAFYFSPVNTKNHPLAEAAFLEKSSNIYALVGSQTNDLFDVDFQSVGAEFYIPNSIFYAGLGVTRAKADGGSWDSQWNASLGVTPIDGLLVWTSFYEDVDYSDYINLNAKYVMSLGGEQALNIEGSFADADGGEEFGIAADYYIDRNLSIGTAYSYVNADEDIKDFTVRARQFFTNSLSFDLSYTFGDQDDSWGIGASYRF